MNKPAFITLIFALLFLFVNGQQANIQPGWVIVKYKPGYVNTKISDKSEIEQLVSFDIKNVVPMFPWVKDQKDNETYNLKNIYKIQFDEQVPVSKMVKLLSNSTIFEYVTPLYIPELLYVPNDPYLYNQYYLLIIKAFEAFDITTGDTNIVIGIVDTGIDLYHQDLSDNIKLNYADPINGIDDDLDGFVDNYRGWDLGENDNNPQSTTNAHGTYVSGMASAVADNSLGIAGVGFKTKLLPVKASNSSGALTNAWEGVVYAADHGCKIINCSWGDTIINPLADDVIAYAIEYRKCLVVASCGNSRTDKPFYPASCKGVLSVAATIANDNKWRNSSYGIHVDIAAPGVGVFTTVNNNTYGAGEGTSFASPLVAGAAALVWAHNPEMTADQITQRLRISSDVVDTLPENLFFQRQMGYGRLNVFNALTRTDLPSVRMTSFDLVSGSRVLPADTLEVSINICNYLAQASGTTIRLTTDSPYADVIDDIWYAGKLKTLESKTNSDEPFKILISSDVPADYTIRFWLDYRDQGYADYQAFEIMVNPSFINVEKDGFATTFNSTGKFGYYTYGGNYGLGFIYKNKRNILSDGGFIIAASNHEVASSFQNDRQFEMLERIDSGEVRTKYWWAKSKFSTENRINTKLNIEHEVQVLYKNSNPVIYNLYRITNTADAETTIKTAMYADWDLIGNNLNKAEYVDEQKLVYTSSLYVESLFSGICWLNNSSANPYAFDFKVGGNGGIDITDGFSNDEKWYAMTNSRPAAGNDTLPVDAAIMLSGDFVTIGAGETAEVAYAVIVADNYYNLVESARQARELYQYGSVKLVNGQDFSFQIFPNPASGSNSITINFTECPDKMSLLNAQGIPICEFKLLYDNVLTIPVNQLSSGVYFIQVQFKGNFFIKKLLVIK